MKKILLILLLLTGMASAQLQVNINANGNLVAWYPQTLDSITLSFTDGSHSRITHGHPISADSTYAYAKIDTMPNGGYFNGTLIYWPHAGSTDTTVFSILVFPTTEKTPATTTPSINLTFGELVDSFYIKMGYPDTSNYYVFDTVRTASPATYFVDTLSVDSVGSHIAQITYFADATAHYYYDSWFNMAQAGGGITSLPDSLWDRLDTIMTYIGKPGVSTPQVSLNMKLGNLSGGAGENLSDKIDSVQNNVGVAGVSTEKVTIHMKLGNYTGGAGSNVKDAIEAVSVASGSGAFAVYLYVLNIADSSAIFDARVRMTAGGANYVCKTTPTGLATFSLDAGNYLAYASKTNYSQHEIPDSISFSGDAQDTIYMDYYPVGTASDPALCRVVGRLRTGSNVGLSGYVVSATLSSDSTMVTYDTGTVVVETQVSTQTDNLGDWYLDLVPNKLLNDTLSKWIIQIPALQIYKAVIVPDSAGWRFR